MKRLFYTLTFILLSLSISAQDNVAVEIQDLSNANLRKTMENNASKLLTAINEAESSNSQSINYSGINIEQDAKDVLSMLWSSIHMRVVEEDIVEKCLTLRSRNRIRGYEIMRIPVEMKPFADNYKDDLNQEVTITFNTQGGISDFVISSGIHQYSTLMQEAVGVDDLDRRMQILHYVEQFRTAYCQKDLAFMENVFSNDALIITGRKVQRKNAEIGLKPEYVYDKQTKVEYLSRLKGIFARNQYVNVKFSDITIERNGAKPWIYGVTCVQDWQTKRANGGHYEDLGVVFMLWDFSDENHPQIHVRTWQATDDDKVFNTKSFKL
ncbi:MAG: nuclear transport factor 2 family protein [Bacteroidaceae bacterium]|nr:nuclear transport factor 2 family protein [Bacteroidaceae bacterium]